MIVRSLIITIKRYWHELWGPPMLQVMQPCSGPAAPWNKRTKTIEDRRHLLQHGWAAVVWQRRFGSGGLAAVVWQRRSGSGSLAAVALERWFYAR